jgi:glycosyltransferase involved in cell wall biosynthesis
LPEILGDAGVRVHNTNMKGTGWLRTMGYLIQQVRSNRIQVVHTHLTRAAYIGHALGMVTRVPIVTSVHIANNDQIYRRLARRNNRLVAVSNYVAGMLHGNGVPDRFIDTVYNGTDFADIKVAERGPVLDGLGIPRDRQVVGLVAKVCRDKGQLELVEAMKDVRRDHPNSHVLFVGRIEEDFKEEIESAVNEAKLTEHTTFTGVRHDIPKLLDSMALATLPSVMETFGVAAIEAMARRKAVVATRVGALPEVIRDRQTGILVDLRPDSIAEAVSYLLTNEREREEMGERGRELVERKFTLDRMTDRFESVYRRAARMA